MGYPGYDAERAIAHANMNLNQISHWIDSYGPNRERDPEAALWGRVSKLSEEVGEVTAAMIGATNQNPRKGQTHGNEDVARELLDVALTALAAFAHLHGNHSCSVDALFEHIEYVAKRAEVWQEVR